MDLGTISFRPGDARTEARAPAAAILVMAAARQSTSPTARVQARLPVPRVRTAAAFAGPVAAAIARWRGGWADGA